MLQICLATRAKESVAHSRITQTNNGLHWLLFKVFQALKFRLLWVRLAEIIRYDVSLQLIILQEATRWTASRYSSVGIELSPSTRACGVALPHEASIPSQAASGLIESSKSLFLEKLITTLLSGRAGFDTIWTRCHGGHWVKKPWILHSLLRWETRGVMYCVHLLLL